MQHVATQPQIIFCSSTRRLLTSRSRLVAHSRDSSGDLEMEEAFVCIMGLKDQTLMTPSTSKLATLRPEQSTLGVEWNWWDIFLPQILRCNPLILPVLATHQFVLQELELLALLPARFTVTGTMKHTKLQMQSIIPLSNTCFPK